MTKMTLTMCSLLLVLGGCGGGGGGSEPEPAPAPEPAPDPDQLASPLTPPEGDPAPDPVEPEAAPQAVTAGDFGLDGYQPPGQEAAPAWPVLLADLSGGRRLYVSPHGADSNPGSAERPFRSIARAARAATPGTLVLVAPGNYSGGFRTSVDGSAQQRIAFVSTRKWGARIAPPPASRNRTAWDNRGDYVDIVGFEIDGSSYQGGVRWTHGIYNGGSHDAIRNNRVHHIGQLAPCTSAGGAAIGVDSYYGGVQAAVVANLVHDIGPAGCRFVQGIYISTSARVVNNVVYRVAEGGIHLWHDAHNVIVANNTVTASNTGIIIGGGDFYRRSAGNDHTAVFSNIVFDNKRGVAEHGKTGANNTYSNNLVFQNSSYDWRLKNGVRHSGTVSAAPHFVTPLADGVPDLRPAPGSPAIGRASPMHAEATDFAGRARNAQAGFDIGAYQH